MPHREGPILAGQRAMAFGDSISMGSAIGVALVAGCAYACGLNVTGSSSDEVAALPQTPAVGAPSAAGSEAGDPNVTASPSDGAACATPSTPTPSPGSPAVDSGTQAADGGVLLACMSSSDCNGDRRCCYDATTGATCKKSCAVQEQALCLLGMGGCGGNGVCSPMTGTPDVSVGRCDFTEE
jgi:hypothetical protein